MATDSNVQGVIDALRRGNVPGKAHEYRLANFGPDLTGVYDSLRTDLQGFHNRVRAGRGWIVQGTGFRVQHATYALLKACILASNDVYCFDFPALGSLWADKVTEEVLERFDAAHVLGFLNFYNHQHSGYVWGEAERVRSEGYMMKWLTQGRAPVIHVVGEWSKCDWYSAEVREYLTTHCDVVTVEG